MIDFASDETHVLINPRLPDHDRQSLVTLVKSVPALRAHIWLATSGTTGAIKMTALSKRALLVSAAAVNRHLESTSSDVWCCVLPTFHVGGLGIHARAALTGARVLTADWDAQRFAEVCRSERVTLSSLVPAQVTDLVREGINAPPSLRAIVVGGGAMPRELYDAARGLGWPVLPSYGMTETCSQVATAKGDAPDLILLGHVEARVEADGRLALRSDALLTGYAEWARKRSSGAPAASAAGTKNGARRFVPFPRGSWLVTDDLGEVDGPLLRVFGRLGEFVKIGGESVDLQRLDAILAAIAGADAAIVAVEDDRLGHVIHLVFAAGDAEGIARAFNERVAPFERSRAVHRVDTIPRTPLGKLMRNKLADSL